MERNGHFQLTYMITANSRSDATKLAESIRVEQSVEMPIDALPAGASRALGEIVSINPSNEEDFWMVSISYPNFLAGGDITQLINILYGNISLYPGIKVVNANDHYFNGHFNGPSFGLKGIRELLNRKDQKPLSCTALKPVGLSANELAERARLFARGGIDIIKDDHGVTDQQSASFHDRVSACVQAVRTGEQHSGKKTLYFPNITTSPVKILSRFQEAVELGADGVLICPQLAGLETLHEIAKFNQIPIMAHPSFSGGYIIHKTSGFTPSFYYGKLWRALGADAIIYPNAGGRFTLSVDTCLEMNEQMRIPFCGFNPALPTPAGGIHLNTIPDLLNLYGHEICYLVGGSLYQHPSGIEKATKQFTQLMEAHDE